MARQVAFTKHEAALLLDAYLKVVSGELSRMDSVKECSWMLRLMAFNSGIEIDDVYRNVNGISFQMASIESAYHGRTMMKPATRLFKETVNLFKTDKEKYKKLLKEAKDMADTKQNNEAAFTSWLSENVSASQQLSELYMALVEIEQQAKKVRLIRRSLYETIDPFAVKKIRANIEQNKVFKFTHKRQWGRITSALNYLVQFAIQNEDKINSKESSPEAAPELKRDKPESALRADLVQIVAESVQQADVAQQESDKSKETVSSDANYETINFENIEAMAFTKPVLFSYFEEVKPESSWKGLYVDACSSLLNDYPDVFARLKRESMSGKGKTWLVDEKHLHLLAIPKKIEDDYFVETNHSASDFVKNLKWLFDECSVDYDNVVITYVGKEKRDTTATPIIISDSPKRQYYREDKDSFYRWLKEDQHMAEGTCRSYVSAIRSAEHFAKELGLAQVKLYTDNIDEAKATADALFANDGFRRCNEDQHNRFRAAITKLLAFYGSNWSPTETETSRKTEFRSSQIPAIQMDVTPYKTILAEHFPKGYRLESALDMKRMRRYYEALTGKELDIDQVKLESAIKNCGIVYNGRLYMPQNMLSDDMKEQILSFIDRCFEEGRSAVYYEAIFREFSDELLDHSIFNANMLKAYLSYYVSDRYYIGRSYLAREYRSDVDPVKEVSQCLKQYDTPVLIDELCDSLSHIAEDRIRYILGSNGEFVRNSKGEYFHVDSLDLTEEEIENIAVIIDTAIEEHKFISGNELYVAVQKKYPYTFEKNAAFSVIGWRDALKYRIGDRFSFVGNIISKAGTSMSMSDVFTEYGKGRSRFSLDELEQFADSIGTTIYFDSLYTYAIRISHQWFAAKSDAHFSVVETDKVLDRFCSGNYMPISSVSEFATFPEASFPWTEYLLEQYVASFSEKFYLLHGNYNKNCAVGAIVRKTSRFNSFDDLVTNVLARSDVPLRKKDGLNYLAANGYIARRSYTNIEALIIDARAMRNQKEK